jgi:hypothetical protein
MSPGLQRRDSAACQGVKALRRSLARHLLRAHSWRLAEFASPEASTVSCAAAPWRWQAQGLRGAGEFSDAVLRLAKPVRSKRISTCTVICQQGLALAADRRWCLDVRVIRIPEDEAGLIPHLVAIKRDPAL